MMAHENTAEPAKANVKLLVFAALTILVAIAGVTRGLQLAAEDEAATEAPALIADEDPARGEG